MHVPLEESVRECQLWNFNNHEYNWVTQELNLILATISFSSKICGSPSNCWVNSVANVKSHNTHERKTPKNEKFCTNTFTFTLKTLSKDSLPFSNVCENICAIFSWDTDFKICENLQNRSGGQSWVWPPGAGTRVTSGDGLTMGTRGL